MSEKPKDLKPWLKENIAKLAHNNDTACLSDQLESANFLPYMQALFTEIEKEHTGATFEAVYTEFEASKAPVATASTMRI